MRLEEQHVLTLVKMPLELELAISLPHVVKSKKSSTEFLLRSQLPTFSNLYFTQGTVLESF